MLPGLQLGVYTSQTGTLVSDWTAIAEDVELSKDEHGCKTLTCFVPMTFIEAWLFCNAPGIPHIELSYNGFPVWQGRLEDKSLRLEPGGISVVAFGYYRAFSDQPYTATHTSAAPSTIIGALLSNAPALSTNTKLIQNPGTTITERYEDLYPSEIIERLLKLGDDQTPPRMWECGVNRDYYVYFRPRGSAGKTWYVSASESGFEINYTLENVWNSAYAVYANSSNSRTVTSTATDAPSISRHGLTRQAMVSSRTKSSTQAGRMRDAYLDDHAEQTPSAVIPFTEIYDGAGIAWPLWMLESGDLIVEQVLPPTLGSAIDKVSTFYIKEYTYNVSNNTIRVVPESHLTSLEEQVAGENSPLGRMKKRLEVVETAVGFSSDVNPGGGSGGSNLVPGGLIALFNGDCPTGWTEYTTARGRTIVGVPSGGTVEGTVGSALTNLSTRTISTVVAHVHSGTSLSNSSDASHTHGAGSYGVASEASHTHTDGTLANSAESAHTHSVDPPATTSGLEPQDHTHQVDPPNTTTTGGTAHSHGPGTGGTSGFIIGKTGGALNVGGGGANTADVTPTGTESAHTHDINIATFNSGGISAQHTHSVNIAAFDSAAGSSHNHTITGTTSAGSSHDHAFSGTSAAGSSHTHTISGNTGSTGSATVDVTMPYIQLRLCQKD